MSEIRRGPHRVPTRSAGHDQIRGHGRLRSLPVARVIGLILLLLSAACARRLPEIRGRVLDGRTGAPIGGAIVTRFLFGPAPINLVDSSRPLPIKGGEFSTRSRADGTFILPPFSASGLVGMSWSVFASGFMPYSIANRKATWSSDRCTGFEPLGSDPWGTAAFTRNDDRLELEVRLTPPTLDGVTFERYDWNAKGVVPYTPDPKDFDPLAEYFRRVTRLTTEGIIPRRVCLHEASAYAKKGLPLSDPLATVFLEIAGAPILEHPVPRDFDPDVTEIRRTIADYCDHARASVFCERSAVRIGYIRDSVRKGVSGAQ